MTPFTFTIDLPDLPPVGNCHRCVYTKINGETTHTDVGNEDKTFSVQVIPGDKVTVKVWFVNNVKWRCSNHFGFCVEGTVPTNYYPQWCWEFTIFGAESPYIVDADARLCGHQPFRVGDEGDELKIEAKIIVSFMELKHTTDSYIMCRHENQVATHSVYPERGQ